MGRLPPGARVGSFEIVGLLGAGGMGEVYRAHDTRLLRDVAIKLLPAADAANEEARTRLLREARAAAALNHPHICTIYEVGECDGQTYIAMELVDGRPLDSVIPPGGLPTSEMLGYAVQIADAVAHAHEHGILHRDLKSANIMSTPAGRVKVLDFGLAKRVSAGDRPDVTTAAMTSMTEAGRIAGTLAYLSPEQLRGQPATAASDVWALGVVLHELAAGERPFTGSTGFEVASAILEQAPPPLPRPAPALQAVISRCLSKVAAERYRDAGELRAALEAVRAGTAAAPAPVPPTTEDARPARRSLWWGAAGAAAALAIAAAATFLFAPGGGAGTTPGIDSIAVLPLENLSGNPDEDYFAAGMQDGLITELARLRALTRVIERRSTQRFARSTLPVAEIAATLGVDAVLTGSVLRAGDRVQVTAQLIDAATDRHLWADRFEREISDVLSIQGDVARAVAAAIGVEVPDEEAQRWSSSRPVDPQTYEAYLRGMYLVARGARGRADRQRGIAILESAIERDPGNAHAYAGLALGNVILGHGPYADAEAWPRARAAALRAVTLDPDLAEAHSALAEVQMYYEWNWEEAEASFRRANELNPNLAINHYQYAWHLALFSRWDEAIAEHKRAQELDPLTPQHTVHLGSIYLALGRYDEAIAEARKAIEFAPNAGAAWSVLASGLEAKGLREEAMAAAQKAAAIDPALNLHELGIMYAKHGRTEEARAVLAELEAGPPVPWYVWSLSQLHLALGSRDGAFKWLNHRPAHAFLPWIRVLPAYAPIHDDPRFVRLMEEMRLPPP